MIDRDTQLRRVAAASPSQFAWEAIVAALDHLDPIPEDLFEELRARLKTWPVEIHRPLPLRWLFREPVGISRIGLRPKPWPRGIEFATHLDLREPRPITLTSSGGELLRLFQAPELEGLCSISLGASSVSVKQWGQIAARPTRHSLRHFALQGVTSRIAPFLIGSCFAALEHLDLRDGQLGASDIGMLLQAPALAQLRQLDLANNPIGDAGLLLLAKARCLSGELERTGLTDAGMVHLSRSEHLATLEVLRLSENRIGAPGVAALMTSTHLENLRALHFDRCPIGPDGAQAIGAAQHLYRLRELRLHGGRIGPRGLSTLTKALWFTELEDLDLSYCDLDDAALKHLIQLRTSRLRRLSLGSAAITAHGLGHLLASAAGSHLEELLLHSCVELGPQGAAAIANAPTSARLRVLNLQNCKIGAAGALALASSPYLKGLRELWIWSGDLLHDGKKYVADAKERLQAALPNTAVIG